jgi:8-oxo-dGTP pyrophosphatase MutT (NUDIX family)
MDRPVPDPLAAFAAPRAPRLADALAQRGLRLAFRLMRLWWFLRRPPYDGALVALWHGGRILLIRHSYRDLLGLPGGGIGRREAPEAAARRELLEEVGIELGEGRLALAAEMTLYWECRYDHVRVFAVELDKAPALALDHREIVAAAFVAPAEALRLPLSPPARAYLEAVVRGAPG